MSNTTGERRWVLAAIGKILLDVFLQFSYFSLFLLLCAIQELRIVSPILAMSNVPRMLRSDMLPFLQV